MRRCNWCARFVRADQEPTTRTIIGAQWKDGQVTKTPPRTVRQLLCPECSESWSFPTSPYNQPPDYSLPVEVLG